MTQMIKVMMEIYDPKTGEVLERTLITEKTVEAPKNIMDFGFSHQEQIELLEKCEHTLQSKKQAQPSKIKRKIQKKK